MQREKEVVALILSKIIHDMLVLQYGWIMNENIHLNNVA